MEETVTVKALGTAIQCSAIMPAQILHDDAMKTGTKLRNWLDYLHEMSGGPHAAQQRGMPTLIGFV